MYSVNALSYLDLDVFVLSTIVLEIEHELFLCFVECYTHILVFMPQR